MKRREFGGLVAAVIMAPTLAPESAMRHTKDVAGLETRQVGQVEIAYKSPQVKPSGLQAT